MGKLKVPLKRVACDDCAVYVGRKAKGGQIIELGEAYYVHKGEWVDIIPVPSMTSYFNMLGLAADALTMKKANAENVKETAVKAFDDFEELIEQLAAAVYDWNWTDIEGKKLPNPHNNLKVIRRLTADEILWLVKAIQGETGEERKND